VGVSALPQPPEGMEIARVDVIVRLRRKDERLKAPRVKGA
jgi:hypothetical protein